MGILGRAARGVEAGVIAAGAVELSFLVLDVVRLEPLATPLALAGVVPTASGVVLDPGTMSGVLAVLWGAWQLVLLTAAHLATFGAAGVACALLFDWSRPGGIARHAAVVGLCVAAFVATVALGGSLVALGSVGAGPAVAMNVLAAIILGGGLRLVSLDTE